MKTNRILQFFTLMMCAVAFAFVTGCEGPAGPAGPAGTAGADGSNGLDGVNGVDANETCKVCHNEETIGLNSATTQFNAGGHSDGTYYDRGGECAACHNNEGFVARVGYTSASDIYTYDGPAENAISCYTCHKIHQAYDADDWNLTFAAQVTETILGTKTEAITSGSFTDNGNSNLCLQCHQSRDRGNVPTVDSTDPVTTSSHWGPHYGVQGNVLNAMGGVSIVGDATYPEQGVGAHAALASACITCHMPAGNHELEVSYSSCATAGCHATADAAEDAQEALHIAVKADMDAIGAKLTTDGVMQEQDDNPGYYEPVAGDVTADEARAIWNYMVVYQDHGYGIHNPTYIKSLLANTKQDLGL